ncbi:MAG: hypothetical protein ACJ8AW_11255, partial [Rhodopila sp.]
MAHPAVPWLQILEKPAAEADFRPIAALSASPEAPDCPTLSSGRRPAAQRRPGNTADVTTLIPVVTRLRER